MLDPKSVIAVVPNYNMADSLKELLPQLIKQQYDEIVVIDDTSTDNSVQVIESFKPQVKLIKAVKNEGAAANRNRIIPYLKGRDVIIHFIDADCRLETNETPKIAKEIMKDSTLGLAGGLVKTLEGRQHPWNYGPNISLLSLLTAGLQSLVESIYKRSPRLAVTIRKRFVRLLNGRPDTFQPPQSSDTFWVVEANMVVNSTVFETAGGFDSKLRYHEILDFGYRLKKLGLRCRFDPRIVITHQSLQVRGNRLQRNFGSIKSMIRLITTNGITFK